jgi:hypothetical protein
MFFEKEENRSFIKAFLDLKFLKGVENQFFEKYETETYYDLLRASSNILDNIYNYPKAWDSYTQVNIKLHGQNLIDSIRKSTNSNFNNDHIYPHIKNLYLNCIRFFFEIDFKFKEGGEEHEAFESSFSGIKIKNDAVNNTVNEYLDNEFKLELLYVINSTPLLITKDLFHSDQIKLFSKFDENNETIQETLKATVKTRDEVSQKLDDFTKLLDSKQETVRNLQSTLNKQETAFNFVGLYKGFNELVKKKQKEAKNIFCFLIVIGSALIAFPLSVMISMHNPDDNMPNIAITTHLLNLLPLISLEVILIYFFRVVLHNYKSIKTQVLQVELRQTLCQFIQNYADYSKDIKKDDPAVLEKFENLIFSGIISDSENLPSTFDGMDQITKLLTSLKGK